MRTAIFLGLNLIALAIMQANGIQELKMSDKSVSLYAIFFMMLLTMDVADFFRNKK